MKKKNILFPILTVVFAILAVSGWGIVIYANTAIKSRDDKIAELTEEKELLSKKVEDEEDVTNPYSNYLATSGWEVAFPYTDGVTNAKAEIANVADGAFRIVSIEKDGKTYDINMCGGTASSSENPFYLGEVVRWKNDGSHKEGALDPSTETKSYTLLYKTNRYTYYYRFDNGHVCRKTNSEGYDAGVKAASEMIHKIQIKEQ
jgi:hypothetical protein